MMITSTVLTVMLRVGGLFIFNFEGSSLFLTLHFVSQDHAGLPGI